MYSTETQEDFVFKEAPLKGHHRDIASVAASNTIRDAPRVAAIYRDPQDVRTVIQLARSGLVLSLLLLTSVAGNFYQYYRRPDRIVVDKSSGRVIEINDRVYGATEAVELGPERLTDADKKYIASEFVRSLYQIDPATRSKDLERALRMMVPDSALKFARYLKQDSVLDKQVQESWQSTWTAQDISVDAKDRYTVRILGRQDIHRLENGVTVDEPRQLSLTLKLIADPKGRADRNLRSGFLISSFDYKEIR
jgi:hypothetical protein